MQKIILKIDGMSCSACSVGLEKYLNKQPGVKASVNLVLAQALIEYEDNLTIKDLEKMIKDAGFKSLGVPNLKENETNNQKKINLIIMGIIVIFVLYLTMGHMLNLPAVPFLNAHHFPFNYALTLLILAIIFLIYGFDIIKSGFKNLLHQTPNMDTLVTLGVLASFFYSLANMIFTANYATNLYFESCIVVIYLIKLGRYIEEKSKNKTQAAIQELVQITPEKAIRKNKKLMEEITIDEIKKGDILIVKPGMKIAVDGKITKGQSHVDESFITGEASPVKKAKNDQVIAGSLNIDGTLEYQAEKIGKDSTISEIVRLVVEATNTKAPIAKLADQICSYFVPSVIILALIVFFDYLFAGYNWNVALSTMVTILVVACPCALGLATPLAIVTSVGKAAHQGILIKSSQILEMAHQVDTIVLDKTGTLTYGHLQVAQIHNFSKLSNKELMHQVAALESNTNHPISSAFKEYAQKRNLPPVITKDVKIINGIGLQGKINKTTYYLGSYKLLKKLKLANPYETIENEMQAAGQSIVYVVAGKKILALIGVKDMVRTEAKLAIQKLQTHHDVIMLTGDNEKSAQLIASNLGIKKVYADCLPQEKTKLINELLKAGHKVMMVGDGINDAPSLAQASIGVSMQSGTDIASNTADVILTQNNLLRLVDLINISKKTFRIIKENLFWAFFYNLLMITIAMGIFKAWGLSLNPMLAGLAMMLSSLTVILNTLRLRKGGKKNA